MTKELAPPWLVKVTSVNEKLEELQGTAVFIAPDLLLTCCHVVMGKDDKQPRPFVYLDVAGSAMPVRAAVLHPEPGEHVDLALLRIETPIGNEVPIPGWKTPSLRKDDDVKALGFPQGEFVRSDHQIVQVHKFNLQINGEVYGGASGGVLEHWDGSDGIVCVGLIKWGVTIASGAITHEKIAEYLARHGHSLPAPAPPRPDTSARNLRLYNDYLRGQLGKIDLIGLSTDGIVPKVSIELLWVPAMTRSRASDEVAAHRPVALLDVVNENRVVVIQGEAGTGKSTFLKRIGHALVRTDKANETLRPKFQGQPFWLTVKTLENFITASPRGGGEWPTEDDDPRWIARCLASESAATDACLDLDFFQYHLCNSGADAILLLDGLDEASQEWRTKLARLILKARGHLRCRIAITTRPEVDQAAGRLLGDIPAQFEILPMDDAAVNQFIDLWTRNAGSQRSDAEQHAKRLRDNLDAKPEIRELARNPLMLTVLSVLTYAGRQLPEERAALFGEIVTWLARSRYPDEPGKVNQLIATLGELAMRMIEQKEFNKYQVGFGTAAALIADLAPTLPGGVEQYLEEAWSKSALISKRGGDLIFWHRLLQEYLAARRMANLPDGRRHKLAAAIVQGRQSPEVIRLLAGCMAPEKPELLNMLLAHLVERAEKAQGVEGRAYAAGLLSSVMSDLQPSKNYVNRTDYKEKVQPRYEALIRSVGEIFSREEAGKIPVATRIKIAEALAQGGDARLLLPTAPEYWVKVLGGSFVMGAQAKDPSRVDYDAEAYEHEDRGGEPVNVETFWIGRYPVTVLEYGRYLDAQRITPGEDLKWDEQKEHPSLPMVYVSCAEAEAYCQWAGGRLPTEEEWEFAARAPGEKPRRYPWGNEPPAVEHANYEESWGKGRTPVGLFPAGATPDTGLLDMAGNIWEWTSSPWEEGSERRALRGASFFSGARYLRAACRRDSHPANRYVSIGFRCGREVFS